MIRYDDSGSRLFTCSCDGTIKIWDAWGGAHQKTLRSPVDVQLMGMDVKDKVVIATGSDRTVRVWSLDTERVFHTLTGHASKLYACRLTPDAKTVVSGGTDRKVMTWDVATGNRLRMISCSSIVNAVAVSADGSYIATGHQDTSMRMWDLRSGKMVLAVTDCHSNTVTSVEFTQSGKILTNSRDNTLSLVDLVAGKTVSRFGDMAYKSAYNWSSADSSPSAEFVGAGSANGQAFVWSTAGVTTAATKATVVLDHSDKRIAAFAFNPSGSGRCATADENGSVVLWKSKKQV
jgi:autophagy-related protein 16